MGVHSDPTGPSNMANNAKSLRGQLGLRSSALAPTSSKLTTQYMVMDHMKNHYSKITNAKPAIDNRAPRSISSSQKVRDRDTREGKRRPVSGMSVNYPVRPYSAMTGHDDDIYDEDQWGDVDPEDEVERQVREIMRKKLNTNTNQIHRTNVAHGGTSQSPYYSARMGQTTHHRPASARSSARSVHSARYNMDRTAMPTKTVTQKTYDGDVIEKHNHVFTQPEKPFTPRVLKSNRVSRIAQSKYYTAPPQKRETDESTNAKEATSPKPKPRAKPRMNAGMDKSGEMTDTLMFESLQSRDFSKYSDDREQVVPRLDISLDKDNMNWIKEQAMKAEIRAKSGGMSRINEDQMLDSNDLEQTGNVTLTGGSLNKTTRSFGTKTFNNSQRLSTDFNNLKKPVQGKREEELQYVEFIKEVTDDVLNRGVFTDRVLKQVFESHIAKKKGKLNEEKMRSMLSQVRQDLDIKDESESADFSPLDTTSSLGSRLHTRYSRGRTGEQTFGSTMDSQNTYNFKDTSSGDMFSTIHSEKENDDLSATQALKSYQLDLTRHVENEEGDESPGEIAQSENEMEKTDHVIEADNKSVKSSKSAKSSKSVHSAHVADDRSVKSGKSSGHRSVTSSTHHQDSLSVKSGKSQTSQRSGGFKPSAKPRAPAQNNQDGAESSEDQSTQQGYEDEEDGEYEESDEENF